VVNRLIILSENTPLYGEGVLLDYQYELSNIPGWVRKDVRDIVYVKENEWLDELDAWHKKLSQQASKLTKWWNLLPGSRLIVTKSANNFELKPILFSLAVIDFYSNSDNEIFWIKGVPKEVKKYLFEWSKQVGGVEIDDRNIESNFDLRDTEFFGLLSFLSVLFKQTLYIVRKVSFAKKSPVVPADVIVNSMLLDQNLIHSKGDHFFGHMIDDIEKESEKKIIWFYSDMPDNIQSCKTELNKINRTSIFIHDCFKLSDLWFAVQEVFKTRSLMKNELLNVPPLKISGLEFYEFTFDFVNNLVWNKSPFVELIVYCQIVRVIEESGAKVIIYPYEEKTMEHALLLAASSSPTMIKTIGFAHASYTKGYLYFRRCSGWSQPVPKFIASTGKIACDKFKNHGVPEKQLIVIGSPRSNTYSLPNKNKIYQKNKQVLVLIGHGYELQLFANWLEIIPNLFNGYNLIIRRYPYAWTKEQDLAELRMRSAGVMFNCEDGELISQIDKSHLVLFVSTSAGIEAIIRGCLAIQVSLGNIVSTNHFGETISSDYITYCNTVHELSVKLKEVSSMTQIQYNYYVKKQQEIALELYSNVDLTCINKLFDL